MTLQAAKVLDEAFAVYLTCARVPDPSPISMQTPSWQAPTTPYDFAAALVRSLIPLAYNTDPKDKALTQNIWAAMVETLQVPTIEQVTQMQRNICSFCGWDRKSYDHFAQCR